MQYLDRAGKFVSRSEAYLNGALRDGYAVRVPMMLADSADRVSVTDAERLFFDSAEGRAAASWARHKHNLAEAYKGADARAFTAAEEQRALKQAFTDKQALDADRARWEAELPRLRGEAEACRNAADDARRNGWR